jgi:hypothetical protein
MPAKKAAPKKVAAKKAAKRSAPRKRGAPAGRAMSAEHKAALATGRTAGRAVRQYLEALESHKPKRGRKRTPDSIAARLATIDGQLASAEPIARLGLIQEQIDLQRELAALETATDLAGLEADFVAHAKTYSENKGISYTAWRAIGVSADVLRAAGIDRTRG